MHPSVHLFCLSACISASLSLLSLHTHTYPHGSLPTNLTLCQISNCLHPMTILVPKCENQFNFIILLICIHLYIYVCVCIYAYIYIGNGTPLQYSCLENPMDGGPWYAAVHGVVKSRTRLSDFTFTFHLHALDKEMATHSSVLAWRIPGTGRFPVWWAAVHGVAKSRTRLSDFTFTSFHSYL